MDLWRALLLSAWIPMSAWGAFPQEAGHGDGERIDALFGGDVGNVRPLPGLTAGPRAILLGRTGIDSETLDTLRLYAAESGGELGEFKIAFLDAPWRGEKVRLGVAWSPNGTLRAIKAFDEFGDVVEEAEPFLAQFRGAGAVRLNENSARPIGEVIAKRDAIGLEDEPPKKPHERAAWVLLNHHRLMWRMEDAFSALERARQAGETMREELRALDEVAAEVEAFASNLRAVCRSKTVGQYRKLIQDLREQVDEARKRIDREQRDAAAKIVRGKLKMSCGKCHGNDANEWRKPLEKALRERRDEVGLGSGAFVVGVDVRPGELGDRDAQAFASAVKAAMLAARG